MAFISLLPQDAYSVMYRCAELDNKSDRREKLVLTRLELIVVHHSSIYVLPLFTNNRDLNTTQPYNHGIRTKRKTRS